VERPLGKASPGINMDYKIHLRDIFSPPIVVDVYCDAAVRYTSFASFYIINLPRVNSRIFIFHEILTEGGGTKLHWRCETIDENIEGFN